MAHGLDKTLRGEITRQLKAKAIQVKTSTLVDATIIASASEDDEEGHWVKHKGRRAVHGFKAHLGADADTALVEEIAVTPANINDGKAGPDALPDNLGEVFADSAYRGNHFGDAVERQGCNATHRRQRHVGTGRSRNTGTPQGMEPTDPSYSRPDREGLRHLEAQRWPSTRMRCCPINERLNCFLRTKDDLFAIRLYARLSFVA
ncbi:transposase [Ensifer adhaerens]|uniref:transposase n=1 Tax=Ensifer adhaerens TaxID=106592 RepID=UPI001F4391CD|nr:transposase [Ensifer adhaerens]